MSTAERVAVPCPGCSPEEPTAHEVLKQRGLATVRCTECGHTHKVDLSESETVERRVVVSQEGDSFSARRAAPPDETLEVGDEFLLDAEEAIMTVRVTSLQLASEQRVEEAAYEDVDTVWTRAVGNVSVNVTVHPKDGDREETRSTKLQVPGDEQFTVGETYDYGEEEFTVEGLVIREDADEYRFGKLDHEGDMAFAKDLKRMYVRDEQSTAWSAW